MLVILVVTLNPVETVVVVVNWQRNKRAQSISVVPNNDIDGTRGSSRILKTTSSSGHGGGGGGCSSIKCAFILTIVVVIIIIIIIVVLLLATDVVTGAPFVCTFTCVARTATGVHDSS